MSRADAWMPLWIGDYLKDTSRLSLAEHGAYLKLLMDSWANGPPSDDDAELCRILGCLPSEWRKIRPKIVRFFAVVDGAWTHKRLEAERAGADERSGKAAFKAQQAAKARWDRVKAGGDGDQIAPSQMLQALPRAMPGDVHVQCPSPVTNNLPTEGRDDTPDAKAWREAVELLTAAGRMKAGPARSFFGKLLKDNSLLPHRLRPSILTASQSGTQDPQGYLTAAARRLGATSGATSAGPDVAKWSDDVWRAALANFEREAAWDVAVMGAKPGEPGCVAPLHLLEQRAAA